MLILLCVIFIVNQIHFLVCSSLGRLENGHVRSKLLLPGQRRNDENNYREVCFC